MRTCQYVKWYIYLYWGWRHFIQYFVLKVVFWREKARLQIIMDEWGVLIALAPPALFRHHEVRHPGDLLPQQGPSSLCRLSGGFKQYFAFQQLIDISSEMKTLSAATAGSADQVSHSRVRHPRRHLGREAGAGGQGGAQLPLWPDKVHFYGQSPVCNSWGARTKEEP